MLFFSFSFSSSLASFLFPLYLLSLPLSSYEYKCLSLLSLTHSSLRTLFFHSSLSLLSLLRHFYVYPISIYYLPLSIAIQLFSFNPLLWLSSHVLLSVSLLLFSSLISHSDYLPMSFSLSLSSVFFLTTPLSLTLSLFLHSHLSSL
jgi:hypothetical protein